MDKDYRTDLDGLYHTPVDQENTKDDCDDGCDEKEWRHGGNCEHKNGYTATISPEDETAATADGCCSCPDYAKERCELDDYEIISDVLGSEKQLVKLYSTALCESAEESLRGIIKDNLLECAKDQYSAYEYMQERGLYPVEQAPEQKIQEAKSQFNELV